MSELTVSVTAQHIAKEMVADTDLAYEIFNELAWYVYETPGGDRFFNLIFRDVFENENSDILYLFEDMLDQFKHLKEDYEVPNPNPST